MVIVHLSKMHLVGSNVKEHFEGLKRNAACKMNICTKLTVYDTIINCIIRVADFFFLLLTLISRYDTVFRRLKCTGN